MPTSGAIFAIAVKTNPTDHVASRNCADRFKALFSAAMIAAAFPIGTIPVSAGLLNGGFESGLSGWASSGTVTFAGSAPYVATEGSRMVVFNNGNRFPDGILHQSFATTPGVRYMLRFDMGVLAYNPNEQRLQVDLTGGAMLASQVFSMSRTGTVPIRWQAQEIGFTADSMLTVLTFRDRSVTSANLDLLLDNVRLSPPIIETQPSTVAVSSGGSATFQVVAWGGVLGYQWRLNGEPIPGAIGSFHTINHVGISNEGSYDVVVTNSEGSTTSAAASLVFARETLVNGGFEAGYVGWTAGGNQEIQSTAPYAAT